MSNLSRKERKKLAEDRRRERRLRWVDIAKKSMERGLPFKSALAACSMDAAKLSTETPQLSSEIEMALTEFAKVVNLTKCIGRRGKKEASPPQHVSEPTNTISVCIAESSGHLLAHIMAQLFTDGWETLEKLRWCPECRHYFTVLYFP